MRGAALGYDGLGKPILAFPSVTSKGESRIAPYIKQGMFAYLVQYSYHQHIIVYNMKYHTMVLEVEVPLLLWIINSYEFLAALL